MAFSRRRRTSQLRTIRPSKETVDRRRQDPKRVLMATGNNTGEVVRRTRPATYREVVRLLGAEVSVRKIARMCKVSPATIEAIRNSESRDVGAVKHDLRSISARIAYGAAEKLEDELAAGTIKGTQLVPVYGVAVDKVVALSDSVPSTSININISSPADLYSEMKAITAQIIQDSQPALTAPTVIEAEILP